MSKRHKDSDYKRLWRNGQEAIVKLHNTNVDLGKLLEDANNQLKRFHALERAGLKEVTQ